MELKKVLDKLTDHNMHVHVLDTLLPVHTTLYDTHYIMKDEKIVHVGTVDTIEAFALRLK